MKTVLPLFTTSSIAKKISSFLISFFLLSYSFAGIIITPATTSVDISADKAANATNPAFTLLGDISLAETKANDFANTGGRSKTLILTAPSGWIFNTASGNISVNKAGDFKAVSMKVTAGMITIDFIITGTNHKDVLNISGIEVKATDGAILPCLGQIHIAAANTGSANFPGLKPSRYANGQGGTNFGIISQTTGMATTLAFTNKPDSSIVGIAFEQQPVIITQDQFGNPTTNGLQAVQNVKVKLSSGTGDLAGTVTLNIGTSGGNGIVSFSDLRVNTRGSKKLMAVSGSLTFALTNEFIVYEKNTTTGVSAEYNPDWICMTKAMDNNGSFFN